MMPLMLTACSSKDTTNQTNTSTAYLEAINAAYAKEGAQCIVYRQDQLGDLDPVRLAELQPTINVLVKAQLVNVNPAQVQVPDPMGGTVTVKGVHVALSDLGNAAYKKDLGGFCFGDLKADSITGTQTGQVGGKEVTTATYTYSLHNLANWANVLTEIPDIQAATQGKTSTGSALIAQTEHGYEATLILARQ